MDFYRSFWVDELFLRQKWEIVYHALMIWVRKLCSCEDWTEAHRHNASREGANVMRRKTCRDSVSTLLESSGRLRHSEKTVPDSESYTPAEVAYNSGGTIGFCEDEPSRKLSLLFLTHPPQHVPIFFPQSNAVFPFIPFLLLFLCHSLPATKRPKSSE